MPCKDRKVYILHSLFGTCTNINNTKSGEGIKMKKCIICLNEDEQLMCWRKHMTQKKILISFPPTLKNPKNLIT